MRTVAGDESVPKRIKEKTHGTEDAARYAYGKRMQQQLAAGYVLAGPSKVLAGAPPEAVGSALLADEYFAAGDERFLSEVLRVTAGGKLAGLAERWYTDARPWARRALLAYIDDGCAPAPQGTRCRACRAASTRGQAPRRARRAASIATASRRATRSAWRTGGR